MATEIGDPENSPRLEQPPRQFFTPFTDEPQLSARDVLQSITSRWLWLIIGAVAGVVLSIIIGRVMPATYRATMIVAPAPSNTTPSGGAIDTLLGGKGADIAALFTGGSTTVSPFDLYTRYLTSERLASRLDQRYGLMKEVFADQWDANAKAWRRRAGILPATKAALYRLFGLTGWNPPASSDLAKYIDTRLNSVRVERTGLLEVSFDHRDPKTAARLLTLISNEADSIVREEERRRLDRQVEYARGQLEVATVIAHREVLANMLASIEQKRLLTVPDIAFAAIVVQPAVVPLRPRSPNPFVLLVMGVFGGLAVAVGAAVLTGTMRSDGS